MNIVMATLALVGVGVRPAVCEVWLIGDTSTGQVFELVGFLPRLHSS